MRLARIRLGVELVGEMRVAAVAHDRVAALAGRPCAVAQASLVLDDLGDERPGTLVAVYVRQPLASQDERSLVLS